jgi:hypothetical protein
VSTAAEFLIPAERHLVRTATHIIAEDDDANRRHVTLNFASIAAAQKVAGVREGSVAASG